MEIVNLIFKSLGVAVLLLVLFSALIYKDKEKEKYYTAAVIELIVLIWSMG